MEPTDVLRSGMPSKQLNSRTRNMNRLIDAELILSSLKSSSHSGLEQNCIDCECFL